MTIPLSETPQKRTVAEAIWLNYFNQTLFEKGLVTEQQRNKIRLLIKNRTPSASGTTRLH